MRAAILADIHANLAALEAVLKAIEDQGGVDELWCLGDIVDYGPDPHECVELIRKRCSVCVAGNHDWAAIGKMSLIDFPPAIAVVTRWTMGQLTPEDVAFLNSLPLTLVKGDFTLAHGSPRDPIWEYILSATEAEENLAYFKTRYCLVGHSHVPLLFECDHGCTLQELNPDIDMKHGENRVNLGRSAIENKPEPIIRLGEKRLIINPGGVGQPRDDNPRAAYAIFDSEARTITLHRVEYAVSLTQQRMRQNGLPEWLIQRLAYGH